MKSHSLCLIFMLLAIQIVFPFFYYYVLLLKLFIGTNYLQTLTL
jgi:hypothetical protein